jgi:hypothetical protein
MEMHAPASFFETHGITTSRRIGRKQRAAGSMPETLTRRGNVITGFLGRVKAAFPRAMRR